MARNKEKQFGNLNRLILLNEKEEYEKAHPLRPKLNTLETPEEVQKWLPSIKRDIDFYLKKLQVTCYSDAHVDECKDKVVKLEKEFKAFVRKIKKLSPCPLDVIPWTSRPYKRKKSDCAVEDSSKEFKRIALPILDNERKDSPSSNGVSSQCADIDWSLMNQPLNFSSMTTNDEIVVDKRTITSVSLSNQCIENGTLNNDGECNSQKTETAPIQTPLFIEKGPNPKANETKQIYSIVNYDSSESESS